MIRGSFRRRARAAPPTTPAAGPDSMMWAGECRGERCRGQAAVGLHQLQRRLDAQRAQPGIQRGDVGAHDRLHIGVDDRRAGARIFLDLRQDFAADRDRHIRQRGPHRRGDRLLVRRIGVAVQQADRDAGDVLRAQHGDHRIQAGRIQRNRHRSVRAHLFDHFQAQPTFHQRARLGPADVVQHRHAQVADFQDIAKTPCGDQRGFRALRLPARCSMPTVVACSTSLTAPGRSAQQRAQARR